MGEAGCADHDEKGLAVECEHRGCIDVVVGGAQCRECKRWWGTAEFIGWMQAIRSESSRQAARIAELEGERDTARNKFRESFIEARGVEDICGSCGGLGTRTYGSTATWQSAAGGQMPTVDVCDHCWGSGDEHRHGTDLRKVKERIAELEVHRETLRVDLSAANREVEERVQAFGDEHDRQCEATQAEIDRLTADLCDPLDAENEKLLRDLFADEDDDHLTRRLFATVDQLRAREARLREALEYLHNGTRDYSARGLGETLPVDYEMPPSTAKRVRALIEAALASSADAPAETTWRNCLMRSSAAGEPVRCGKALTEWADHSWRCPDGHYNAVADLRREYLGRLVREVWVVWAKDQDHPKPHHLLPWEHISENDREVDRRIGETLLGIRDWRNGQRPVRTVEQAMADATPAESPGELTAEQTAADALAEAVRANFRPTLEQTGDEWDNLDAALTAYDRACAARAKGW